MTTARAILQDALTFHLNRLAPGETMDDDTLGVCLRALNYVADEWNGTKQFLFRELLTTGTVTGASGTLGTTWAGLVNGDTILGATYRDGGIDVPMRGPLPMAWYADVPDKGTAGVPRDFAHDGAATLFFYPAPAGVPVTLRTREAVSSFADLDTVHDMPFGYSSALSACTAELLAPTMNADVFVACARKANIARSRIGAQAVDPAIIDAVPRSGGNILSGWSR